MVDDLAGRQRITSEKFMSAILSEGLFEAYLELRAQMNDAARRNKATPPAGNKQDGQDDVPFEGYLFHVILLRCQLVIS